MRFDYFYMIFLSTAFFSTSTEHVRIKKQKNEQQPEKSIGPPKRTILSNGFESMLNVNINCQQCRRCATVKMKIDLLSFLSTNDRHSHLVLLHWSVSNERFHITAEYSKNVNGLFLKVKRLYPAKLSELT